MPRHVDAAFTCLLCYAADIYLPPPMITPRHIRLLLRLLIAAAACLSAPYATLTMPWRFYFDVSLFMLYACRYAAIYFAMTLLRFDRYRLLFMLLSSFIFATPTCPLILMALRLMRQYLPIPPFARRCRRYAITTLLHFMPFIEYAFYAADAAFRRHIDFAGATPLMFDAFTQPHMRQR